MDLIIQRLPRFILAILLTTCSSLLADELQTGSLAAPPGPSPVVVHANFDLRDIDSINDQDESVEVTGTLTLKWTDPRQAFDPAEAGVKEKLYHGDYQFNELSPGWYPQVYLANESGSFESRGILFRVHPDGSAILTVPINTTAEVDLNMRWFPFDQQKLELHFAILGFDSSEVVFEGESEATFVPRISQWELRGVSSKVRSQMTNEIHSSEFIVTLDLKRKFAFMLRLVVSPLALIVALSWSIFWMERSSLGDRINISFVGILTSVAYQFVVGELIPHVAYLSLMQAFLNISFFFMCAGAVMNLVVGAYDKSGREAFGDLIDKRCRWFFPLAYLAANLCAVLVIKLLPPVL